MKKLEKNQELQSLAEKNGLDVKNAVKLTDDSINNIAVSIVSMLLANKAKDERFEIAMRSRKQARAVKIELVNDYKTQAMQLINIYKTQQKNA